MYPEWRFAVSGAQGATLLAPICRASFCVDTCRSPCIRTISGFFRSSSITSVLNHGVLLDPELPRGNLRAPVLLVGVRMLRVGNRRRPQNAYRRRDGHLLPAHAPSPLFPVDRRLARG